VATLPNKCYGLFVIKYLGAVLNHLDQTPNEYSLAPLILFFLSLWLMEYTIESV